MFTGVNGTDIDYVWHKVEPYIQKVFDKTDTNGFYTTKDVYNLISGRDMQLWIAYEGEEIEAAFVTQIVIYPQCKVFDIPFVGGVNIDHWLLEAWDILKQYGKSMGCKHIRGYGRRGWTRILPEKPEYIGAWSVKL